MSIQELVDKAISESRKELRRRSGKYSPSMLGRCYRAQVWNRRNEPITNPSNARGLRVFEAGKLFHDFVQGIIIKNHKDIQKEVRVEDEHFLGFADLVNGEVVWDIKSQHSGAFHYMTKAKDIGEDKKPNVLQVLFYARLLGKHEGRLVFISKDDLCVAEYCFRLNEKWTKELEKEVNTLIDYWTKGELPPAEPRAYKQKDGSFKECEYCNWKDKCKGGVK